VVKKTQLKAQYTKLEVVNGGMEITAQGNPAIKKDKTGGGQAPVKPPKPLQCARNPASSTQP